MGTCNKGRQTKNLIMAGAGNSSDIEHVMNWLEAGGKEEQKKDFNIAGRDVKCEVIAVDRNGVVKFYEESLCPYSVDAAYFAIGSGASVALGAMAAGASAKDAVLAATKHDLNTGPPVKTLNIKSLQKKEPKPKKKPKKKKK